MLTKEQNDRLTRVGPGTPLGELMRRYWHPVAAVSQLKDKYTLPVRLLGEDFVLYKDRKGTYGFIEPRCPHRRMHFVYGVPEEEGLRCAYHGWMFDETGRCVEQPYEQTQDPEGHFRDKVHIAAYPVQEMAGLLFTYLGPQPAPLLPRWDVYAVDNVVRDIGYAVLRCNWLQCQENSLDPVHLEWLHAQFANYVCEMIGKPHLQRPRRNHVKIGFDVFDYGIVKRRVWEGGSEDDTEWKDGHPIVFPNMLRQGGSGLDLSWNIPNGVGRAGLMGPAFQIRTPIDDTNTAHWWVACYPRHPEDPEQRPEDIPLYHPDVPELTTEGQPIWEQLDTNSAQDPAAWITQGDIADRTRETLGRSDTGIILFRRMIEQNIRIVERGGDPMNTFRDPATNVYLGMTTEAYHRGTGAAVRSRQGAATKHSPILNARGVPGPSEALQIRPGVSEVPVGARS